jgi:hypothetical protein
MFHFTCPFLNVLSRIGVPSCLPCSPRWKLCFDLDGWWPHVMFWPCWMCRPGGPSLPFNLLQSPRRTNRDLPLDKAPGSDDFTGRLYRSTWSIIKDDMVRAFQAIFVMDCQSFHHLNEALLFWCTTLRRFSLRLWSIVSPHIFHAWYRKTRALA